MLNVAGSSYDFGSVIFAVLQECEHRRAGFVDAEAANHLRQVASEKLSEIRQSYREAGGTESYWDALSREITETVLPQYIPAAIEQTKRERTNYGLWRGGDIIARASFALIGLAIDGLLLRATFIPWPVRGAAMILALFGWFYPEVKRATSDYRHSRLLNRLINDGEKYQKNEKIHYLSSAQLEDAFRELDSLERRSRSETDAAEVRRS